MEFEKLHVVRIFFTLVLCLIGNIFLSWIYQH